MRFERPGAKDRKERVRKALAMLSPCRVCPWKCGVDRNSGERGRCKTGRLVKVASWNLHFGEEPPVSGTRGSGTIFFSGCNLSCVHCQNYPISQLRHGRVMDAGELAGCMLELEGRGAHNINLVTPTHCTPQVMEALDIAFEQGLDIPVVWNSSGYESVDMLELLEGMVDVYMPDLKYSDDGNAKSVSGADRYWEFATKALVEMKRQVGDLVLGDDGVAVRGLLVRHLVLPQDLSGTRGVLEWIARELGTDTAISLMSQYFPAHRAGRLPGMNRRILQSEYKPAVELMKSLGLERGWIQDESLPGGA